MVDASATALVDTGVCIVEDIEGLDERDQLVVRGGQVLGGVARRERGERHLEELALVEVEAARARGDGRLSLTERLQLDELFGREMIDEEIQFGLEEGGELAAGIEGEPVLKEKYKEGALLLLLCAHRQVHRRKGIEGGVLTVEGDLVEHVVEQLGVLNEARGRGEEVRKLHSQEGNVAVDVAAGKHFEERLERDGRVKEVVQLIVDRRGGGSRGEVEGAGGLGVGRRQRKVVHRRRDAGEIQGEDRRTGRVGREYRRPRGAGGQERRRRGCGGRSGKAGRQAGIIMRSDNMSRRKSQRLSERDERLVIVRIFRR